jgi:hypothetical protein
LRTADNDYVFFDWAKRAGIFSDRERRRTFFQVRLGGTFFPGWHARSFSDAALRPKIFHGTKRTDFCSRFSARPA